MVLQTVKDELNVEDNSCNEAGDDGQDEGDSKRVQLGGRLLAGSPARPRADITQLEM